ncbi:B12-binding domain-containing radical SAM protein [Methanobacterium ferruginis]|uniref:B12-binding domain-containing radical SAM protein n=1 Tax=Methanobacterium ferruginis TaxID=710191 RepID=UPI002574460B|nr:radical SAM protein [Methanobacterium ferruginis]
MIPFPARYYVNSYEYGYLHGLKFAKGKFTAMITSRGCQHNCKFCARNFTGMNVYRERSVASVIEEFEEIVEAGYDSVRILDDNLLGNQGRVHRIMDELINRDFKIEIWVTGRCDSADKELYGKMRNAGVKGIYFGLESGNQDVLDFYNKRIKLNEISKALDLSRKMGFFTIGSFILGAPFENKLHFENTVKFAKSLPLDLAAFYTLEYVVGSQLWEEAVMDGKITPTDYIVFSDSHKNLSKFTKEEIETYSNLAHKQFYMRPQYWIDQFLQAVLRKNFRLFKMMITVSKAVMREKIYGN